MRSLLITICLYAFSLTAKGQDITGTWEEHSETRFTSYTKLCIVKICDSYVGFTYDSDKEAGHCTADFFATYNKKRQLLRGETTNFIERTYGHVLGLYTLYYKNESGEEILEGRVYQKPDTLWQMLDGIPRMTIIEDPAPEFIRLKKTGLVTDSTAFMRLMASKPCKNDPAPVVIKEKPVMDTTLVTTPPVIIPSVNKEEIVVKPVVDTAVVTPPTPVMEMHTNRKKDTLSVRSTSEKELFIHVYDDAITDGDTISIMHNGRLLAERIRVSAKAFPIKISLSKEDPYHELVLIAHNLGSIPPNTALLVFRYGDEEYRLHAIADLRKNALIIFKYTGE